MKRDKLFVLLFYCSIVLLLIGCAKREIRNIDSQGKNIICFGDSITFGYGANPGEDYPSVLARMTKFTVINAGIDGDTTSEALGRIQSDVLEKTPLLVIIEFGGNDFLRRIPQEATINNVKQMIEKVQAKGAMVAIADISAGVIMGSYHLAFYNLARETNAIFIPEVLSNIFTNSHLKSDFIHPNADGYKIIAQRIYRAILPYLDQNLLARKFGK